MIHGICNCDMMKLENYKIKADEPDIDIVIHDNQYIGIAYLETGTMYDVFDIS